MPGLFVFAILALIVGVVGFFIRKSEKNQAKGYDEMFLGVPLLIAAAVLAVGTVNRSG